MKKTESDRQLTFSFSEGRPDLPPRTGTDVDRPEAVWAGRQSSTGEGEERALMSDVMDRIADLHNLTAALRRVVANGGSPGIDGMRTGQLTDWFAGHWRSLQQSLRAGWYQPAPVRTVYIPKPGGGQRQLGIPTCRDRLVQQAISQVLSACWEPTFSEFSYGFRPGRNAQQGLKQAAHHVREGYRYIVDLDLEKFFDQVNHDRLMGKLAARITDRRLLKLIGKYLRAGLVQDGLTSQRTKGTPQGSPLSPLLSNIVLDELDRELEARGHRFVRYADDLIILVRSERAARRLMDSITGFIENRLRLKVNRAKSQICRPWELNFLGHTILADGRLGLSRQSEQRLKTNLRRLTRRNRGISLTQLIRQLNPVLRGWLAYFRLARMRKRLRRIEEWLRRRIRCFRLKQCKRSIGVARFLQEAGLPQWRAWLLASSSKGWYRKANSPQAAEAMNLHWFARLGLYSLSANYH